MTTSRDRMVDVFPVVFDFKRGEQPSSKKLTKWVLLLDSAFNQVSMAVGDPWDYQKHSSTVIPGGLLSLSPQKLSQTTLARTIGPSEYIGPLGETINSGPTTVDVSINVDGASSWFFGFPFVKNVGLVTPQMLSSGTISFLDVEDITFSGDAGLTAYFATHHSDPRGMTDKGDYHIDFAAGLIYTATAIDPDDATSTGEVTVTIDNLGYIGAGIPWGTHNVIPIWQDDLNTGISIIEDILGPGYYNIVLPTHLSDELPRVGTPSDAASASMTGEGQIVGTDSLIGDRYQTVFAQRPIRGMSYRLPYSLEKTCQNGDILPEGVIMLWQNDPGRFIPLTEFQFVSATELKLTCPELDNVDPDSYNTSDYRLIVIGSSLAEQVNYLSATIRDNIGQGLAYGSTASFPGITYSPLISHDRLRDRFSFSGNREDEWESFTDSFDSWQTRFAFAESHVPTNPHPQYIHRAGWMEQDKEGNSGNAMRGEFVFSSQLDPHVGAGTDILALGGQLWDTWGIRWGGGPDSSFNRDRQNSNLRWKGSRYGSGNLWDGEPYDVSTYNDLDIHLNFSNVLTGASPWNIATSAPTFNTEYMYGALAYTPIWGTPLYISGRSNKITGGGRYGLDVPDEKSAMGGLIAFDLQGRREMNYMKLVYPDRALYNHLFNEINFPIFNYSACSRQDPTLPRLCTTPAVYHNWHFATSVGDISYYGRFSSDQVREYRFRGISEAQAPMMGHQSIAAGEIIENASTKFVTIDDIPIVAVDATGSLVFLEGNYMAHLFPGSKLKINSPNASAGYYFVKWSFFLPKVAGEQLDYTVVEVSPFSGGPLVQQLTPSGTATCIGQEMMSKFTSPALLGTDYLNVYGNAIFFSDTGSGGLTSFTSRGGMWLDFGHTLDAYLGDQTPSAIFYHPENADTSPYGAYYAFSLSESGHDEPNMFGKQTRWPLVVGDNVGIWGEVSNTVQFRAMAEQSEGGYFARILLNKAGLGTLWSENEEGASSVSTWNGGVTVLAEKDIHITPGRNLYVGNETTDKMIFSVGRQTWLEEESLNFYTNGEILFNTFGSNTQGFRVNGGTFGEPAPYYPYYECWFRPSGVLLKQNYDARTESYFWMTQLGINIYTDKYLWLTAGTTLRLNIKDELKFVFDEDTTFKMEGLHIGSPGITNAIYVDSSGYLRMVMPGPV